MAIPQEIINTGSDRRGMKSFKTYIVGFILSLLLTLFSFALVKWQALTPTSLCFCLMLLGLTQLLVQVICFLRLNAGAEGRWNLVAFLFTILIVLVIVIGSLWIMFNLNYNMMH